jgi:hypothetical protein
MSRKHFSLLLIVTVAAALLVLLVPGKTGRESEAERARLLPGLQDQVNQLDWLRITGPGGAVVATLSRGEGYWRVDEAGGYRADWQQLKTLLADLARAEIVERKTDNPEYYDRLGVADVTQAGAAGLMIEFREDGGLPAVIVGNRSEGRDGHYVRLRDTAQSVLVDRSLEVPADRMSWLEQDIVHVAESEVVEVDVLHADGERVVARKISADDENFALQDIPEGREIQSAWSVNSLANGLASLTLEAVLPDSDIDWAGATRFGLVTADGLRVDADLVAIESAAGGESEAAAAEHWLRLQASLYETAVESAVEAPEEGAGAARERAASINQRVAGWAYRIPKYKYDSMSKRMEQLLKAPGDSES